MNKEFKYDCHVHSKEGSKDGTLSIYDVIRVLDEKEFDGMIVTDHNSYKGYKFYIEKMPNLFRGFSVIKGIEYDTSDAGHMLVIIPSNVDLKILTYRGLSLNQLLDIVHDYGGVVGVAHPYHEKFIALGKSHKYKDNLNILKSVDFIEGFNATEFEKDNQRAIELAKKYNLPITGGSDSHGLRSLGSAYTLFERKINNEDEFIAYIKEKKETEVGGDYYKHTLRRRLGPLNIILVYLYGLWNLLLTIIYWPLRQKELKKL